MPEEEPVRERWVCMGLRLTPKGEKRTEWLPPGTKPKDALWYGGKMSSSRFVVGGAYDMRVVRADGKTTVWGGAGAYRGLAEEITTEQRTEWQAEERVTETRLARAAMERKAKGRDALDEALAPLAEIASKLRTRQERAAFTAYVLGQLHKGW